jgi:hypothetical protein
MADQILKEVTHLGSTLADLATKQLDSVLGELRGPTGDADGAQGMGQRVNAGTLAFNVFQLVSRVGSIMKELSEYDLVRKGEPTLILGASTPLSGLTLSEGSQLRYTLLLENNGPDEKGLKVAVDLERDDGKPARVEYDAPFDVIFMSERRRVVIVSEALYAGKYALRIAVYGQEGIRARKTVMITVLAAPQQHNP